MIGRRDFLMLAAGAALPLAAFGAWDKGDVVALPPLTLLDGRRLDPATLRGKVVVLEFWASWCPFCARQNRHIEALYRAHRSRGLEVLAISIDKTQKAAADYLKSRGYTFLAAMQNPGYERIFRLRRGLPQTYVIDREGRLALVEMGEMFEEDIRDIAKLL